MSHASILTATDNPKGYFILPAFNDPTFSDLTILSGPSKTPFRIHKVIVSATSDFFKAICKPGNCSNNGCQTIELPNIPPTVLQTVLLWQYGQQYVLPRHTPPPSSPAPESQSVKTLDQNETRVSDELLVIKTYSAAEQLQIPLLQSAILKAVADEFRFRPWVRFTRPVDFMQNLCNHRQHLLHLNPNQPITKTKASEASVSPSMDYSGKINFVSHIRNDQALNNKVDILECVSAMVASHNLKDLANEIETLKQEKLKAKKEGATNGIEDYLDRDDAFFAVILPVWEDFVKKREQKRVLDPRNEYVSPDF
ncbi:hypothetical protein TWF718_001829 [Orbilia javanica]|uniref:BTB domain-containing protein n=1 Tax=Orbilia javanica TaxID=47235 RepID=A0AAN8P2Y9_9PEZI